MEFHFFCFCLFPFFAFYANFTIIGRVQYGVFPCWALDLMWSLHVCTSPINIILTLIWRRSFNSTHTCSEQYFSDKSDECHSFLLPALLTSQATSLHCLGSHLTRMWDTTQYELRLHRRIDYTNQLALSPDAQMNVKYGLVCFLLLFLIYICFYIKS